MAIRWNAAEVLHCCSEAEAELAAAKPYFDQAKPHMEKAAGLLRQIQKIEQVPQYMSGPLDWCSNSIEQAFRDFQALQGDIDKVRSHVPAGEAAKMRYRGKLLNMGLQVERTAIASSSYDPNARYRAYQERLDRENRELERERKSDKQLTLARV